MTSMETEEINNLFVNFTYARDPDGAKCPFSAHLRRANPRDMLDSTAAPPVDPDAPSRMSSVLNNRRRLLRRGLPYGRSDDATTDEGEHGDDARFVIPAATGSGQAPFICDRPPQFVETRGGAYFFVPSMTALRLIAQGLTDPT